MTDYCFETTCGNCKTSGVWERLSNQNILVVPCTGCAEDNNWTWNGRICLGVSGISANENREQTVDEFAGLIYDIIQPRYDMNIEAQRDEFNEYLNSVPDEVKSKYKNLCEWLLYKR